MSVKVTKVACQSCGADLEVDESIRYVTCRYCHSRLEICHHPSSVYTKLLERVERTQRSTERELRLIRLERQLDRLEKQWHAFVDSVSSRKRDGRAAPPSGSDAIGVVVVTAILGIGFLVEGLSGLAMWPLAVLGGGILFAGFMIARHSRRRAREFEAMKTRYLQQRSAIHARISAAEREARFPPMRRSGKASLP